VLANKLESARRDGVLLGGRAADGDGRASDIREVDLAVALKGVLADFESVLAVLVGDAARTTHNSRYLWRGLGGSTSRGTGSLSLVFKLLSFIDNCSIFVVIFRLDGAPVVGTSTAFGDGGIHAIAGL